MELDYADSLHGLAIKQDKTEFKSLHHLLLCLLILQNLLVICRLSCLLKHSSELSAGLCSQNDYYTTAYWCLPDSGPVCYEKEMLSV